MKKALVVIASMLILMTSCKKDPKMVYEPSKFPTESKKNELGVFKIHVKRQSGAIYVHVKINDAVSFDFAYDTGCSLLLSLSITEATQLAKSGALVVDDVVGEIETGLADGSLSKEAVVRIKQISLMDLDGKEHILNNIAAVVSPNEQAPLLFGLPLMEALGSSYEISQNEDVIIFKE